MGESSLATSAHPDLLDRALAFYRALMSTTAPAATHDDTGLGGRLLFAGELNQQSASMVIAANVAGCATLIATADAASQKQAVRDATIDFVVNSLDEALRILKNEIRKHATVAVCVGITPAQAISEMQQRGVVPDFVADLPELAQTLSCLGPATRVINVREPAEDQVSVSWSVGATPARWMPTLDAIAIECLHAHPGMQRWIRLSPRFAGRAASHRRAIYCDRTSAAQIVTSFKESLASQSIATDISLNLHDHGQTSSFAFSADAAC